MRTRVIDSFDVKGRVAVEYGASGVVVIYAPSDDGRDPPVEGERVWVFRPDGWMRAAVIGEVKATGTSPGFFLAGLTKSDVPVGTGLHWGRDVAPPLTTADALASAGVSGSDVFRIGSTRCG